MQQIGVMATKVGMTQVYAQDGVRVPVTVLKVEPNIVVAKRTEEVDGYNAVQLGTGAIREKLVTKPRGGHFKKLDITPTRHLREFRVPAKQLEGIEVGQSLGVSMFEGVESLDISGVSKGKGFAGVMKRHNFAGFPRSHGTHEYFRHGGSIGMRAQPGKVLKGKRMAGHMGDERVTTLNLRIVSIDAEEGVILVRGAIPGGKNGLIEIRASSRKPKALHGVSGAIVEEGLKNPMKASKAGVKAKPAAKKK